MASNPRYDGKPLLRLLELYVLKAIGELAPAEQETLERMAPKLQAIYGGNGGWQDAVAAAVHLPHDMPDTVQGMWAKNLEIAREWRDPASPDVRGDVRRE